MKGITLLITLLVLLTSCATPLAMRRIESQCSSFCGSKKRIQKLYMSTEGEAQLMCMCRDEREFVYGFDFTQHMFDKEE